MSAAHENDNGGSAAERIKIDFFDTITVLVGPSETKYILHETYVCATSDYFRRICDSDWGGSPDHTVRLPEVTEEVFDIYNSFLYTKTLDMRGEDETSVLSLECNQSLIGIVKIQILKVAIHAYALGEKVRDAMFRNAVCDKVRLLMRLCRYTGFPDSIDMLCENVSMSSKLTRLFVDWFVCCAYDSTPFQKLLKKVPREFLEEVAGASVKERTVSVMKRHPKLRGPCFYHDHPEGVPICE